MKITKFKLILGNDYTLEDLPTDTHTEILQGCYHQGSCDEDCQAATKYFKVDIVVD